MVTLERILVLTLLSASFAVGGCEQAALSPEGARVAVTRNPPLQDCQPVGYIVGETRGVTASWNSNSSLIDHAMNDLRNKAAALGANYVQSDTPFVGERTGNGPTATITGAAYRCRSLM